MKIQFIRNTVACGKHRSAGEKDELPNDIAKMLIAYGKAVSLEPPPPKVAPAEVAKNSGK